MMPTVESALLRAVITTHQQAIERLDELVEGMRGEQANWKPEPGKWSIAECIEHLNQSLAGYIGLMAPAIDEAREQGRTGDEPYGRGTLAGRLLVRFLEQPTRKAPAPRVFRPAASQLQIDEVARTFRQLCSELIELALRSDGLALGTIRIATPVSILIRLSLAQAFRVHTLHTPRHLTQAERVKLHEDFPDS